MIGLFLLFVVGVVGGGEGVGVMAAALVATRGNRILVLKVTFPFGLLRIP